MTDRPCPVCGAALAPGAVIDSGCITRTRQLLREVPVLLVELDVAISRQTSMPPAGGTGGCPEGCEHRADSARCVAGVRLVLDLRASDAALALRTMLHGWARVWDEESPRVDREGQPMVTWIAVREQLMGSTQGQAWLLEAVSLSGRLWAPEFALDVQAAVEEGWRAVDRPPDSTIVGRCQQCAQPIYAPEGADVVRCRACGMSASRADVREQSLAESRTLLTATKLAAVLDVPEGTVRSWVSRGKLTRRRYDMDGRPLYRVADGAALKARGEVEESA